MKIGKKYEKRNLRAYLMHYGRKSRKFTNAIIGRYSKVGNEPVFDAGAFPFVTELESHWEVIRDEADRILKYRDHLAPLQRISPDHAKLANDTKWRAFFLYGYGYRFDRNCARCPETSRLVARIPDLQSAFFSILAPGKHIPPHKGPTKALMTWHLGLHVPDDRDRCFMRVHDQILHWEEGRSIVFDDSYKHEVRNDTNQERVVLLIHLRRPVAFPGSLVSRGFLGAIKLSPFVQDARRNQDAWEDEFDQVLGDGSRA